MHIEHVFRHEYGPLVASLLRRLGDEHLDAVEDAVQYAMMKALDFWVQESMPASPSAWLYKVAYRRFLSERRDNQNRRRLVEVEAGTLQWNEEKIEEIPLKGEMTDAFLVTLFQACHDVLPLESRLVFTLKCLCGFTVKEIALRLFISEDNVYKRFNRAKKLLAQHTTKELSHHDMNQRLSSVYQVLYLIFTEGYLSSHPDNAIREDLCEEAIHLTLVLKDSKYGNTPDTLALLGLMYLHFARIRGRKTDEGTLLLLEHQDRAQWDKALMATGLAYLQRAATGDEISRYHIEAGIAAEHCLAESFAKTRWDRIVQSYELLGKLYPSAITHVNKAIAVAEWKGPEAGLQVLQSLEIPAWFERSYHWYAVEADLLLRSGKSSQARDKAEHAIQLAPTTQIKNLLLRRLR